MRQLQSPALLVKSHVRSGLALDLVVPFINPRLTEVALRAAKGLGAGLDSAIRLVKVQVVPFPLDLRFSPVPVEFLEAQMEHLRGNEESIPITSEIRFAREFESGLMGTLRFRSLIVLASKERPWRTRTERLEEFLKRAGYTVIVVPESDENV
jgi:hypothetical protein